LCCIIGYTVGIMYKDYKLHKELTQIGNRLEAIKKIDESIRKRIDMKEVVSDEEKTKVLTEMIRIEGELELLNRLKGFI